MSRSVCYLSGQFFRVNSLHLQQKPALRLLSTGNGQTTTVISGRWRRFWRSWVPIPTSVGVTVLAVLQWRRIQRNRSEEQRVAVAKDWEVTCYRIIPCRVFSRAWGWLSNCHVPGPLRSYVYGLYSSMYGVNLDEMAGDLTDYPSLAQFFTRELRQGVRPIDLSNCVVSPADGRVLNNGKICSCHVEQIKGVTYKIQRFLGEPTWRPTAKKPELNMDCDIEFVREVAAGWSKSNRMDENDNEVVAHKNKRVVPEGYWGGIDIVRYLFRPVEEECYVTENWEEYKSQLLTDPRNELYQTVVYLAPGDYHRFHSPTHWQVKFRRHFQGELLSVNPLIAGWVPELFSLNERVVYVGEWEHGFFSMTAVGATNVGSIRVHSDKTLHTNTRKWRDGSRHRDKYMNVVWKKGEEVGEFRMGSTIVLIFEAPKDFSFNVGQNQRVKVGEALTCPLRNCSN
ncbi:phosphatidylserine decarboxylase proenzyme, mitochondrial-like isoform X2 [Homalodisca vitripennis]|uniref:phosphatidylserine decarboxylase proenzyme, mitochondrial-like isoform X2 n=1 Tax=Homalodisca vitripennis TaxID=197043 RepID=UPI001EEC93D3|nr:phosphatidylserine decarboxylase proenzyme, mitochondrial-like isoform X2 [Homalodisca vitripennis]